jgi:Cu/Ag efflux pump CusA
VGRTVAVVLGIVVLGGLLVGGLPALRSGSVLPELEDRNVLVRLEAAPGTSLTEMDRVTGRVAAELRGLDGVTSVGTHVGRAIGADEVVDVDAGEIWLTVGGDAEYADTLSAVRATVAGYPGLAGQVSTYADDRLTAVSADTGDALVVRVFGAEYATLQEQAELVRQAMQTVEGVISPRVEPLVSQPTVSVQVDLAAAQRVGLRPGDVRREVSTMVSGITVGSLYEQQAIFDVVVWGDPRTRSSVAALEALPLHTASGLPVSLGEVATVDVSPTPTVIAHDGVARSLDVIAEVRGRSAADVAADATERLQRMTFAHEYRAEVLGDAVQRADDRWEATLAAIGAGVLVFLLLQAATNSWRGAVALFVAAPLAGSGTLLASYLLDGARSAGVLAALLAVVALAVRQSLVLVRRAQALRGPDGETSAADALRSAAREQAPPVVIAVLVTAAVFLPAAVMGGGAGLELLQPFAVGLLGGLITSTVVVLVLVPALVAGVGGLRPAPVVGPDTPDGEPPDSQHHGRHERVDAPEIVRPREGTREGSAVMRIGRIHGIASLFAAAGLALTGCQTAASGSEAEDAINAAASVEEAPGGGPSRLTLAEASVERLGVVTGPVTGDPGNLAIPYSAVVYDAEGGTWTFVEVDTRVYQRAEITISSIEGDQVRLSAGPEPGSAVVTVGAAELVGVEAGISGGE